MHRLRLRRQHRTAERLARSVRIQECLCLHRRIYRNQLDTAPADADAIVQFTSGDLDLSALTYKEAVKYGGTLTVKIPDGYKVVDGEKTSYTYDELKANGTVTVKVTQNQ